MGVWGKVKFLFQIFGREKMINIQKYEPTLWPYFFWHDNPTKEQNDKLPECLRKKEEYMDERENISS